MPTEILGELRQRTVIRIAGLYAVAGWAVFQVISTLFPALDLPKWMVSAAALVFLAGFPIAVLLASITEITPDGLRFIPRRRWTFATGRFGWIDWLAAVLVVLLLGYAAVQLAALWRSADGIRDNLFAQGPSQSVAVLPFSHYSGNADDGFFADGLTEELIDSLVQSPSLKVAGRTSSFFFKGKNEDLREIGRKLGVANIVEGSVRREGQRLRVTAQLIKVADGFHVWSGSYDRTVDDALAIQTELANTVAEKLKAELGEKLAKPAGPARAPLAYRIELVARAKLRTQELADLQSARRLFLQLIKQEPNNPRAYAGLAQSSMFLAQNFLALDFETARRESEQAIARALAIDPKSADAWRARGAYERVLSIRSGQGTHSALALRAYQRAITYDPADAESKVLLGNQYLSQGEPDKAIALLKDALSTDPLSRAGQLALASAYGATGDYPEARRAYERIIILFPKFTSGRVGYAQMLMFNLGRLDEAILLLDDPGIRAQDPLATLLLAACYANLGMDAELRSTIAGIDPKSTVAPIARAALLQYDRKRNAVIALAQQMHRSDRDPVWQSIQPVERLLIGDLGGARALLPMQMPGVFMDPPNIDGTHDIDLAIAAQILRQTGSAPRADALLAARLSASSQQARLGKDAQFLAGRGYVLAAANRTDEALDMFERAYASGWRLPIEFDYFVRSEDYPFMKAVTAAPRWKLLMKALAKDLATMRDRVKATNSATENAPVAALGAAPGPLPRRGNA